MEQKESFSSGSDFPQEKTCAMVLLDRIPAKQDENRRILFEATTVQAAEVALLFGMTAAVRTGAGARHDLADDGS